LVTTFRPAFYYLEFSQPLKYNKVFFSFLSDKNAILFLRGKELTLRFLIQRFFSRHKRKPAG